MALVPFTGLITAATLNANFSNHVTTMTSLATRGQKDMPVHHKVANLAAASVFDYVDFTPEDDMEIRVLRVYALDAAGGQVVKASLEVANGDDFFLLNKTVEVSTGTLAAATVDQQSLDRRTVTGDRLRLLKGVPYRLRLTRVSGGSAVDDARAMLVLRTIRRAG